MTYAELLHVLAEEGIDADDSRIDLGNIFKDGVLKDCDVNHVRDLLHVWLHPPGANDYDSAADEHHFDEVALEAEFHNRVTEDGAELTPMPKGLPWPFGDGEPQAIPRPPRRSH